MKKWLAVFCGLGLLGLLSGCHRGGEVDSDSRQPDEIRIVSLAPNLTEAVFAVGAGDLLVGRTSACDYPAEVSRVPIVGGFGRPSLEMLIKVHPTLVLESDLADKTVGAKIESLGMRLVRLPTGSIEDIAAMLREVGELSGHAARGAILADDMEREIQQMRASNQGRRRLKVYAEIWGDPLTTCGSKSVLAEMISLAGGENIGNSVGRDYFRISSESVLTAAPDVIFCLYMVKANGVAAALANRPGWQKIPAVKNGAVFDGLNNDLILRPGPRVLEGVKILRQHILEAGKSLK